jgi:hypothetical protein
MKLGLQNYAAIITIDDSYIKFNNNKLNGLQMCSIAKYYRILHRVVQLVSQHNLKISKHRHIQNLHQREQ